MTSALATCGYRLIVPSRFGYLRTTLPDEPTIAKQADAYVELPDHIGVQQVFVVGVSAGHGPRCSSQSVIRTAVARWC